MRPAVYIALGLAGLSLTGCASPYKANTRLPAAFEAPQAAAVSAGVTSADMQTWWTQFGDAQLNALVEEALKSSPDARSAAARLREAQATAGSALIAFLPQGNGVGSTKETHTTQTSGTTINIPGFSNNGQSEASSANLNVSWELDLFGRIFAVAKAARGDSAAARFNFEGTRTSLAANVADVYFQTQGLAIQLADARETVRIQTEFQRIADTKLARGLASRADADRVAGDLAQARSQAAGVEAELQAARRTLLVLIGRGADPSSAIEIRTALPALPQVPASVPGDLLARRPDVREAHARVASQVGRLTYSQLAFFPTFTLTPGVGLSRSSQPGFRSATEFWSIGAAVSQPVLSIPRLLTDLKAQNARTEQAVIAYEKAVQSAYGDADNALVRLDADARRIALLTDGEARAHRAADAGRIRYKAGLDDLQSALGAEASWRAVRTQLTSAQVQGLRRAVQTYKALGGGWPVLTTDKEAR
ncbi:MAG: transporter [Alphaproteobacteria bacterium PA2]|nr:MAG: transporter [Alphaproteobacteria bacterium PA2]